MIRGRVGTLNQVYEAFKYLWQMYFGMDGNICTDTVKTGLYLLQLCTMINYIVILCSSGG